MILIVLRTLRRNDPTSLPSAESRRRSMLPGLLSSTCLAGAGIVNNVHRDGSSMC